MKITVRLFGAFRNYASVPRLEVELMGDGTLEALRVALAERLAGQAPGAGDPRALLKDSAFATESGVLAESARLVDGASVAVLPPVCGG